MYKRPLYKHNKWHFGIKLARYYGFIGLWSIWFRVQVLMLFWLFCNLALFDILWLHCMSILVQIFERIGHQ